MLDGDYLSTLRDVNGSDYLAAAQRAGYGAETYEAMLRGARLTDKDLGAFVELHIEQVRGGRVEVREQRCAGHLFYAHGLLTNAHLTHPPRRVRFWRRKGWRLAW